MDQHTPTATSLAATGTAAIRGCACGAYYVCVDSVTLHLAPDQFSACARMFKLALGRSAAGTLERATGDGR